MVKMLTLWMIFSVVDFTVILFIEQLGSVMCAPLGTEVMLLPLGRLLSALASSFSYWLSGSNGQ